MTQKSTQLALYYYDTCPFCYRVRSAIEQLGIDVELRNTMSDPTHRADLISGGGRGTVPCLQITDPNDDVTWMYESGDIVRYLEREFGQAA